MRPAELDEIVGHAAILAEDSFLGRIVRGAEPRSCILWGPPGSGKTTIARLLAGNAGYELESLSAVLSGVKDVREVIAQAPRTAGASKAAARSAVRRRDPPLQQEHSRMRSSRTWRRASITLVGATTENPSFELTEPAAVALPRRSSSSRSTLDDVRRRFSIACDRATPSAVSASTGLSLDDEARRLPRRAGRRRRPRRPRRAGGRGRSSRSGAEVQRRSTWRSPSRACSARPWPTTRAGEEHYNVISAFIKSMRKPAMPTRRVYWLARMLEAGEDPLFIARSAW